jgi:hypothetical protein
MLMQTLTDIISLNQGSLSVDNPLVLGPIAAFIFTVFITEIIVSGKAYRREVSENQRLRALTEKVIPLAEHMSSTTAEAVEATKNVTRVLDQVVDALRQSREGR